MTEQEMEERIEGLEQLIYTLRQLGFDEAGLRDRLLPQAGASYHRYVEQRQMDEGQMFYSIECTVPATVPEFRGYTARLVPVDGTAPRQHYFEYTGDYTDMHLKEAYNLLCGRATIKFNRRSEEPLIYVGRWTVLGPNGLRQAPDFDYGALLQAMPLTEGLGSDDGHRIIYCLIRGDKVPATFTLDGSEVNVFIEADPKNSKLKVTDAGGRPIEWQQEIQPAPDRPTPTDDKGKKPILIKRRPGKGPKQ